MGERREKRAALEAMKARLRKAGHSTETAEKIAKDAAQRSDRRTKN